MRLEKTQRERGMKSQCKEYVLIGLMDESRKTSSGNRRRRRIGREHLLFIEGKAKKRRQIRTIDVINQGFLEDNLI